MEIPLSILDNDAYKFYMQRAIISDPDLQFVDAKYEFINRGDTRFPAEMVPLLRKDIDELANCGLSADERLYLDKACPFLGPAYLDLLSTYRFNPSEVTIDIKDGKLSVIIEGPWYHTILWEVPLMALISSTYFELTDDRTLDPGAIADSAGNKADFLWALEAKFIDFGTRRRYAYDIHNMILPPLIERGGTVFLGTSNIHFAMKHNIKPIGTQAHEWYMAMAALYGYKMAHQVAMNKWLAIYGGELGIVLADTFTSRAFLTDFSEKYAVTFGGVRQDSGSPIEFTKMIVAHYEKLGIDPATKTIVYSDGLNCQKIEAIQRFCSDNDVKINRVFGIGTNLTNDTGITPLNIVIKMTACRRKGSDWIGTVKLSDFDTKHVGRNADIEVCKKELGIE